MEFGRKWIVLVGLFFTLFFPSESVGIRRYETDLFENDFCGHDMSVYSGKCKKIKKCVNLLTEKKVIEVCSFSQEADETLVCCSRDDFYKSRQIFITKIDTICHIFKVLKPTSQVDEQRRAFGLRNVFESI